MHWKFTFFWNKNTSSKWFLAGFFECIQNLLFGNKKLFPKWFFVANQMGFRMNWQPITFFSNRKMFPKWFFNRIQDFTFSQEKFKYKKWKEIDSKILKSGEKNPAGLPQKFIPPPPKGDKRARQKWHFLKKVPLKNPSRT